MNEGIHAERVAVVTGASSGIGRAITIRLVREGARVIGAGRDQAALDTLKAHSEGELEVLAGDLTADGTVDALIERACERFGRAPDVFVANAGRGLPGSPLASSPQAWSDLFELNCVALMRQLRGAVVAMRAERVAGRTSTAADIVVMGSVIGRQVSPFNSVYGATKFAAHSLAEAVRREVASADSIRVTLVEPGTVRSEFQDNAGYDREWFESYANEIGPVLEPDDVARAVSFILAQPPHVHISDVQIRPTRQALP